MGKGGTQQICKIGIQRRIFLSIQTNLFLNNPRILTIISLNNQVNFLYILKQFLNSFQISLSSLMKYRQHFPTKIPPHQFFQTSFLYQTNLLIKRSHNSKITIILPKPEIGHPIIKAQQFRTILSSILLKGSYRYLFS